MQVGGCAAWLLSDATPETVSRLNNVRSCCACSVGVVSKVPTLCWGQLCMPRLRMTALFLRGWFFGFVNNDFHLMITVSCASTSCDESEHRFPGCRLHQCPANTSGQRGRRRNPEGVVTVSGFMVLVFSLTRKCDSVQQSFGSRRNSSSLSNQFARKGVF